jgi:hypothetical protein
MPLKFSLEDKPVFIPDSIPDPFVASASLDTLAVESVQQDCSHHDRSITLRDQFLASVETWRVLCSLAAELKGRVEKGRVYCKAHQKDIAATKLLGSLDLELAALELRIGKEARIQADLEARICDVPNEYLCARCFKVGTRACQCLSEVAS